MAGVQCVETESDANITAEAICCLNDPRLYQNLLYWFIKCGNQLSNLSNLGRGILDEERIGSLIYRNAAPFGQETVGLRWHFRNVDTSATGAGNTSVNRTDRLQNISNIFRLSIIDLDQFRNQRLQLSLAMGRF